MRMKKLLFFAGLLIVFMFVFTISVQAANTKYTFNDVNMDGQIVEIEAGVKTTKKSAYTNCNYFADDYAESLGYYQEAVSAGDTAGDVLDFCVNHFDDRVQ